MEAANHNYVRGPAHLNDHQAIALQFLDKVLPNLRSAGRPFSHTIQVSRFSR